jgi:exopolysaccharide biosynthesis polyprenyl glycosylphosphotransferase
VDALERDTTSETAPAVHAPAAVHTGADGVFVRRSVDLQWAPDPLGEGSDSTATLARDTLYRRALALSDVLATCATMVAIIGVAGRSLSPSALAVVPLVVLLAKTLGLYERDELLVRKTTLEEASSLFQVATVFTLVTWLVQDATVGFSGLVAGLLWPLLFAALVAARASARRIATHLTQPERCIVIGDRGAAESLRRSVGRSHTVNAEIIGRVPLHYGKRRGEDPWGTTLPCSVPFLGDLDTLGSVLVTRQVDRVLIAPSAGVTEDLLEVIRAVKMAGVKVSVVPRLFEVIGSSAAFDDIEGTTLLGIRRYGLTRSSRLMKRALDFVLSTVALVVLSPLLAVVALSIKLDSPGPVLFRQRRIGASGREFEMVKFRTMSHDADARKAELQTLNEADGLFKIADDPRITRVGKLWRRTCIDELPQFINVLRGEMSLVGPRPLVPDDDERVEGWYRRRLHVLPGMTGHWQILGSSRVPLDEMVKIDYLYGANWSLWGDLKILLRTVPYVLARRGQ